MSIGYIFHYEKDEKYVGGSQSEIEGWTYHLILGITRPREHVYNIKGTYKGTYNGNHKLMGRLNIFDCFFLHALGTM